MRLPLAWEYRFAVSSSDAAPPEHHSFHSEQDRLFSIASSAKGDHWDGRLRQTLPIQATSALVGGADAGWFDLTSSQKHSDLWRTLRQTSPQSFVSACCWLESSLGQGRIGISTMPTMRKFIAHGSQIGPAMHVPTSSRLRLQIWPEVHRADTGHELYSCHPILATSSCSPALCDLLLLRSCRCQGVLAIFRRRPWWKRHSVLKWHYG